MVSLADTKGFKIFTCMKIFITGASGFVGGAAAIFFAQQGHTVLGMSRSAATDKYIQSLGSIPVRCNLLTVQPADMSGCDVVIHAAAFLGQWDNYQSYFDTNVTGTESILRVAKEAGVKKIIYISTESVLVNGQDLLSVNENYPYPDTPFYYSKTKQLAEIAVRAANLPHQFETVCLRPRMIWGTGDKVLLPLLKEAVLKNKFSWIGGGQYRISTTHIDNLVSAIDLAIRKAPGGSVYFVTDEKISSIKDFCSQLLQTQGIAVTQKSMPKWLVRVAAVLIEKSWRLFNIRSRPPLTRLGAAIFSSHCTIDSSKIRKELGYMPVISVETGMQQLAAHSKI